MSERENPRLPRWLRLVFRAPLWLYDHRLGALLGHRFLRLEHTGRRSGRRHRTVLEVLHYRRDTGEVVVVSGLGPRADWLLNLTTGGPARVLIGRREGPVGHRILPPGEAVEVLAEYERRSRWMCPVLRAVLSRLVGWRYDGSAAARERLVRQLPMVALVLVAP